MDPNAANNPPGSPGSPQAPQTFTLDKWKEIVPEDIRNDASLKDIKDITSLAKGYVNSQKLIGSKLSIPGENDEAAWNTVYDKLGRPEAADKYQVKRPEIPEGMAYNEDLEKQFLPVAHKLGLNNKQVNALVAWQTETVKQEVEQYKQGMKTAEEGLKKEWGNDYANKVSIAQRVVKDYANQEVVDFLEKTKLGNNPAFVKFIYEIGSALVEDGAAPKGGGSGSGLTAEAAQQKINTLLADPQFAGKYFNSRMEGHKEAVAEIFNLRQVAAGEV